jgi:ATP-dependent RNA circularization protein (DNA/RNA ligase family)
MRENKCLELAIQGELIGPKINGNRAKLDRVQFQVFNIFDHERQSYLHWNDVKALCAKLDLTTVPEIFSGVGYLRATCASGQTSIALSTESFKELANQQRYDSGELAEGIVVKNDDFTVNVKDVGSLVSRISFKVISEQYLLKYGL